MTPLAAYELNKLDRIMVEFEENHDGPYHGVSRSWAQAKLIKFDNNCIHFEMKSGVKFSHQTVHHDSVYVDRKTMKPRLVFCGLAD
jgi:hypothetical protein